MDFTDIAMKKVLFLLLILAFSINVFPQDRTLDFTQFGVTIQPDKRVIVVLASLEAAGLRTPLTNKGEDFRRRLVSDFAGLDKELVAKMANFVAQYKKRNKNVGDSELIAPFISMAYSLTPIPDLVEPNRNSDLPGDLLDVLDYSPLVREFYRRGQVAQKIDDYYKIYQTAGDELRPSTSLMIGQLLDYLNTRPQLSFIERVKSRAQSTKGAKRKIQNTELRERERRFYVVPELLAPKGTINFVNAGDEYFAITPPSTDLTTSEVRRAYLQFVLDPIVLKNSEAIFAQRDAIKALLDTQRKLNPNISPDFVLAISRSMVAAVDARQVEYDKTRNATLQARQKIEVLEAEDVKLKADGKFDQAKRDSLKKEVVKSLNDYTQQLSDETTVFLSDAYETGAVLAFHFNEKFKAIEDSGFDLTESVGNMIATLVGEKETNRIEQNSEARKRGMIEREKRKALFASQPAIVENPLTKRLLEIDNEINGNSFDTARNSLNQLLTSDLVLQSPQEKPRIYYSLGRLESLSAEAAKDLEARNIHLVAAQQAYSEVIQNIVEPNDVRVTQNKIKATDPALISLTYVALARIYEFNEQNEYAIRVYEAAINIGNVTGGAYQAAVSARNRLMKNQ